MKDKILLIEDDKSIQRFLRISLETKDYKVISAETGIEGISLYMTDNPDLILLDLGLPDIDGMEVLSQIRAQSEVAILVVSARGQEHLSAKIWAGLAGPCTGLAENRGENT